ncbi:MAG: hypothetical protein FWC97_10455 [Treponema sp.]|nr:hypothetical protein [Treponema sp.]
MKFEHAQEDYQSYNITLPNPNRDDIKNESLNKEIESKLFYDDKMRGVFFSYIHNEVLRVYITLENDTSAFNKVICQGRK